MRHLLLFLVACTPAAPVRLALLGDTGTGEGPQHQVAAALTAACGDLGCDAVLLLGDNFYASGVESADDPQWVTKFDEPYAALDLPFLSVLGNHDYGASGVGYDFLRASAQVERGERGGKFFMPDRHYAHTIGNVDLYALDTTAILFGEAADQRAAVRKWLAESTGRWKIAYGHHPYWSNGAHGDAGAFDGLVGLDYAGERWKAFFEAELCGKIDLYVAGHDHDIEWMAGPCDMELVVSGGGGATPREMNDNHPTRVKRASNGFFWLEIEGDDARASAFELGAAPVDVHRWRKRQ